MKKKAADINALLTPEYLNSVAGLSLIARIIVEGFTSGRHAGKRVGPGMEFSQYRGYQVGDDLRLLDWKLLARSGRYYIKQSDMDSHTSLTCIMDISASMAHEEKGLSKIHYARVLVAALALLAQGQGDKVGLYALTGEQRILHMPRANKKHFNTLLMALLQLTPSGKWPKVHEARKQLPIGNQREIICFISDMHEHAEELSAFAKGLKTKRNQVVVFQLMGKAERELDYGKQTTFEDLETGERVLVNVQKAKNAYLERLEERNADLRQCFLKEDITFYPFQMGQPLGEVLDVFLNQRVKLG